jgi:hypothetical protein
MRKMSIFLLLAIAVFATAFFSWQYLFSVYETVAKLSPRKTLFHTGENATLIVESLNSLGKRAPFRKVSAQVNVSQGEKSIKIIRKSENVFTLEFIEEGEVTINIGTNFSPYNQILKIKIFDGEKSE